MALWFQPLHDKSCSEYYSQPNIFQNTALSKHNRRRRKVGWNNYNRTVISVLNVFEFLFHKGLVNSTNAIYYIIYLYTTVQATLQYIFTILSTWWQDCCMFKNWCMLAYSMWSCHHSSDYRIFNGIMAITFKTQDMLFTLILNNTIRVGKFTYQLAEIKYTWTKRRYISMAGEHNLYVQGLLREVNTSTCRCFLEHVQEWSF